MDNKPNVFNYHITRTLKGLQDDFDKAKTVANRVKIAEVIDKLIDSQRALEYAKEFARHDYLG